MMEGYVKVARLEDVPTDRGLAVKVSERDVALFRVGEGVYAIKDVCPHMGAPLHTGFLLDDKTVACADHGWPFDLETGNSPSMSGCSVPCYDVKVVDEEIYVSERYRDRPPQ